MKIAPLIALIAAVVAATAGAATTKDFKPGDVRLCGSTRCVMVTSASVAKELGSFVYTGRQPAKVAGPRVGERAFQLRFRNGYVAGIFASARLDRWLSYGVYLERFSRGKWYAVPRKTASDLRRLVAGMEPLRLTPAAIARSR